MNKLTFGNSLVNWPWTWLKYVMIWRFSLSKKICQVDRWDMQIYCSKFYHSQSISTHLYLAILNCLSQNLSHKNCLCYRIEFICTSPVYPYATRCGFWWVFHFGWSLNAEEWKIIGCICLLPNWILWTSLQQLTHVTSWPCICIVLFSEPH